MQSALADGPAIHTCASEPDSAVTIARPCEDPTGYGLNSLDEDLYKRSLVKEDSPTAEPESLG